MRSHRILVAPLAAALACALGGVAGCRCSARPPPGSIEDVAAGMATTCARFSGGRAMCWGASKPGGIVSKVEPDTRRYIPVTGPETAYYPAPVAAEMPPETKQVVLGEAHGCALLASGAVACWGANDRCQIGNGKELAQASLPMNVLSVSRATAIAAGSHQTCIVADGAARCWGASDTERDVPASTCRVRELVAAEPLPVTAVALGAAHGCALRADGTVWCWGDNDSGQLGRGAPEKGVQEATGPVAGLHGVREIAAGARFSCALRGDGSVWCWGANASGALGAGEGPDRASAAPVPGIAGAKQVAAAASHACALIGLGEVRCWGRKEATGDGPREPGSSTVPVRFPAGIRRLALGGGTTMSHSCALGLDGHVYCWGGNFFGQLGNDSTSASPVPVAVVW